MSNEGREEGASTSRGDEQQQIIETLEIELVEIMESKFDHFMLKEIYE
jgi:glucosamine 6-phosphate synthetase-like amidotransferase/phosphosugar isomerase protein